MTFVYYALLQNFKTLEILSLEAEESDLTRRTKAKIFPSCISKTISIDSFIA
jgi:hypothetical protein